jgi:D-aspartate ligase
MKNSLEGFAVASKSAGPGGVSTPGAVVIGGDHMGLGIVRSLGRRGIPVLILDDHHCISRYSRYAWKALRVDDLRDEQTTIDTVLEVGRRFHLKDWVLFPTRDETVAAFSAHRTRLKEFYRVPTGDWNIIQWAWNKKRTYELANRLNIPCPITFNPPSASELQMLYSRLPLAIKPAIKENFFYATGAKAWRADTREELDLLYEKALRQIRPEEILIQEIIPGSGQDQFSYCAFVQNGQPHSTLTARRARQHPREFGRAATYVEAADVPAVAELAERFLRAIRYHGLVEIEFKRDPRDGKYKLLDVNARTWGFHSIGEGCGVDFSYLAYADQAGLPLEPVQGRPGVGWLRLLTDIPTAIADLAHGSLSLREYCRTICATRVESVFCWKDPLPAVAEIALLPYLVKKKFFSRENRPGVATDSPSYQGDQRMKLPVAQDSPELRLGGHTIPER